MLFQAFYKIDAWDFDPPVAAISRVSLVAHQQRFRLNIDPVQVVGEDFDDDGTPSIRAEIVIVALLHAMPESDVADIFRHPPLLGSKGSVNGLRPYPEEYRAFLRSVHERIDSLANRAFDLLRWRCDLTGGPLQLKSELFALHWKDSDDWETVPNDLNSLGCQVPMGAVTLELPHMVKVRVTAEEGSRISMLCDAGVGQPLGHGLLREAWRHRSTDLRSAVVMAVAAAETGFKECVSDLMPDASWLLENVQSPPLVLMIRDYLEKLPARRTIDGAVARPPRSVIRAIQEAVRVRNGLVHGSKIELDPDALSEMMMAIRDLLYLLDYYRGDEWALRYVRPEVVKEMRTAL